jgi:hypothetical protein
MSRQNSPGIIGAIYAIIFFVVAMTLIVSAIDFLVAPLLTEVLQEPNLRNWCGVFSRCASQTQVSLVEYIYNGELWNGLDSARIVHRLKISVLFGALIGIGYAVISNFRRRP